MFSSCVACDGNLIVVTYKGCFLSATLWRNRVIIFDSLIYYLRSEGSKGTFPICFRNWCDACSTIWKSKENKEAEWVIFTIKHVMRLHASVLLATCRSGMLRFQLSTLDIRAVTHRLFVSITLFCNTYRYIDSLCT